MSMVSHICGMNVKNALHSSSWLCYAYCVASKRLRIESAERSWADEMQIKDGKWSNLGGASLEKRVILFTSARLRETSICQNATNSDNTKVFCDNDTK